LATASYQLPAAYQHAVFQPCKIDNLRIKIPFTINGKQVDLLFDTGSSLFSLVTTKENALSIAKGAVIDSLKISNWGDFFYFYGRRTTSPPVFAGKPMSPTTVYYNEDISSTHSSRPNRYGGLPGMPCF